MKQLFVKPARNGLIVRDPQTGKPLSAEGEQKPDTTYWRRRLRDGDVVASTPAKGGKSK